MVKFIDYRTLKAELAFPIVLSHYGIHHNANRDQDMISCPFHDDDQPSCSVNKSKGMFRCFGCGTQGNVLAFICAKEDLDDQNPDELAKGAHYAIEHILGRKPADFARKKLLKGKSTRKAVSSSKGQPEKQSTVKEENKFNKPLTFELKNLVQNHVALDERGITQDTIQVFGLGYCQKGIMQGRLVVPIHNATGELIAYAGRWPNGKPPGGEGKYKLPSGFNKSIELFNQHRAKTMLEDHKWETPLVIVEGFWSVFRLHSAEIPCVATFGSDFSDAQALAIANLTDEAIIIYDGDEAGREGMQRAAGVLSQHVFTRCMRLADGEKPDTMNLDDLRDIW